MNIPSAKTTSSALADTRNEDLVFAFNIWIQPKHMSSDSNVTSSNCLFGKLPSGYQQNIIISAFSCFLLGQKCSKKGLLQKTLSLNTGSSSLCANEKYSSQYSISRLFCFSSPMFPSSLRRGSGSAFAGSIFGVVISLIEFW